MAGSNAQRKYEPQWTPLVESELFANLQAGEHFHLGTIQNALNDEAEGLIANRLRQLLGQDFSKDSGLRRVTTCATTAGGNGVTRTVEAIEGLAGWSDQEAVRSLVRSDYAALAPAESKAEKCVACSKKIKPHQLLRPRSHDSKNLKEYWHVNCWLADDVRNVVQDIRSSKGAIEKQARSARAILQANESFMANRGKRLNPFMIRDRMQFEHWLKGLFMEWEKTTNVKSEYHVTYFNYFKEYAEQILEYMMSNRIPTRQVVVRLAKHLDDEVAESIVTKMKRIPIKTLRYFGLIDNEDEPLGSVPEYIEEKDKHEEVDPALAWAEEALCAETNPEAFFPEKGGSIREAKRICAACPVQKECLDYALNHGERMGIWGGTTPEERKEMARSFESTYEKIITKEIPTKAPTIQNGAIFKMEFEKYSDCRAIAEKYREGFSILLDLNKASESDRVRAVDFLTGMLFSQNGGVEKVSKNIYLLLTSSTQVIGDVALQADVEDKYEHLRELLMA